jgi:hypothetical protein
MLEALSLGAEVCLVGVKSLKAVSKCVAVNPGITVWVVSWL